MKLLSKKEVGAKLGLHPESITRMVREDKFPKPIRLGGDGPSYRVRWPEAEVDAWIEARMAARPVA